MGIPDEGSPFYVLGIVGSHVRSRRATAAAPAGHAAAIYTAGVRADDAAADDDPARTGAYVPPAPAPYVPPTPVSSGLPPAYVAPAAAQVIPAPPPSEGIGFPGQPLPPPGPSNLAVVEPGPPPVLVLPRPRFDPSEPYRIWAQADALVWWVKNAPFNAAVAQNPNPATGVGTVITPGSLDYPTLAGFRFAMGGWFDSNNTIGMEVGFFTTEHASHNLFYGSDGNGNPTLGYPFNSQTPGFPSNFMPISEAGVFSGNVIITPSIQLWGAEVNGVFNIWRNASTEVTLLGGFRYANLQESLVLSALSQFSDGSVMINNDYFGTRNQFYGGQFGPFRLAKRSLLDRRDRQACPRRHRSVRRYSGQYFFQLRRDPLRPVTPGGFFAQQSNSGHFTGGSFSVMPAVELKLSYALSSRTPPVYG